MLVENFVFVSVETRRRHFCRNGNADRVSNALAKRPRSAFHSGRIAKFRMSRRFGMQLPKTFDFRHRQIVAAHVQPGVKEHAAVPGREDEDIAIKPTRLFRVIPQRMTEEHSTDFSTTERKPEMP